MRLVKAVLVGTMLLVSGATAGHADIAVVASIKPVHSLVAAVMEGVGTPSLVMEGAGSPHAYSLKPSQARLLESADVVFWIGHSLETFLVKPLQTVAAQSRTVALLDADGVSRLEFRDDDMFESHLHSETVPHDTEHKGDAHHSDHETDHAEVEVNHRHLHVDPHIWLDPENAKALVEHIAQILIEVDPANADKYDANAKALTSKLASLANNVAMDLKPLRGRGFVVFHDAYQYFEVRFGLRSAGAITFSPEVLPSAERVAEIRDRIRTSGVRCVFSDPQFEPKLVSTVLEGSNATSSVLDPLGTSLEHGPNLYFDLIRAMATSFKSCLGDVS